jgi:hypothetical protein
MTIKTDKKRRVFLLRTVTGCLAIGLTSISSAQVMVDENDPQASSLGYRADATKIDKAKQTKFVGGQACVNCALFQGAGGAAAGACPIFAGKQVAAKGWCTAYAKKAA